MSVKNKEKVRLLADALATDETLMAGLSVVTTAEETIDTIRQDMFNHMSSHATAILQEEEGDIDLVMKVFSKFEHKYKKDNKLQSMPGSYRSSKSVIINALRHGVSLDNGGGTPKGKTALEQQIKQARKTGAPTKRIGGSTSIYKQEEEALLRSAAAAFNVGDGAKRDRAFDSAVSDEELNDLIIAGREAHRRIERMLAELSNAATRRAIPSK